jgi:nucleoside-diphosphate-sugar epimerase
MKKTILITGGAGFIGAWIIRRLWQSATSLRVLDQSTRKDIVGPVVGEGVSQVDWLEGDICDGQTVSEAARGCDAIIHLAGLQLPSCQTDPVRGAMVNVVGSLNAFEAAKRHGVKTVVYMSSAAVFGADDGAAPNPVTHYGAFKLATEGSARSYWRNEGIHSVGLRPYVVYGPGRDVGLTAGVSLACRAAALQQPYVIPFTGGADFLYVEDLAAAIIAAVELSPDGAQVFALPGEVADVDRIVTEISRNAPGARITAKGVRNPTAARLSDVDIRTVIAGIPRTTLADGIRATINFYLPQSR